MRIVLLLKTYNLKLRIHWVMPHKVIVLFRLGKFKRHRNIALWRLVLHCLMWCIWQEMNARSFERCVRSMLELKSFFFHTLFEWSLGLSHLSCFSLPILHDQCNFGS